MSTFFSVIQQQFPKTERSFSKSWNFIVPDENEIYLEGAPTLKEVSMTNQIWCEYCYV